MYASYPTEVNAFFKQFSFVSPFAQVQEYIGAVKHRDLRLVLSDYVTFAHKFRIQLRLRTNPLRFKRILWPVYGKKFHLQIVEDHFEPAGPYTPEDPYAETFDAPDMKVLEEVQELIDQGKATFVQIEDGPGYSLLKDLAGMARNDDGVTMFLLNAEQPYIGCIFGWKMQKGILPDLGPSLTKFQKEYYDHVAGGRPRTGFKKRSKAGLPVTSTKGKTAARQKNDPKDTKPAEPDTSGSAAAEKKTT
jgi:hypothetical protein